jgi:hypothetical protein
MKRCLLAVGLMVCAVLAVAQDASVQPGINRAYDGADYRRWQGMFETEGREVFEKREAIIAALDIRPGMVPSVGIDRVQLVKRQSDWHDRCWVRAAGERYLNKQRAFRRSVSINMGKLLTLNRALTARAVRIVSI